MTAGKLITTAGIIAIAGLASAQVPDLLNALDAGGRAMGAGGSTGATDSNTFSALNNPAGLAYIQQGTVAVAFRNLPEAQSVVSGDFLDPDFDVDRRTGARRLSHVGYATPFRGGVLGASYTIGGYLRDVRSGDNLTDGNLVVRGFDSDLRAQHDFFTLSWGKRSGETNYGVGLVFANQYVRDETTYVVFDNDQNQIDRIVTDNSGNSRGLGVVAGIQTSPNERSIFGASVRTPISLTRNSETRGYLRRIPGKASLAYASRSDFLRDGRDFFAYGAQLDYYFGGDDDGLLQRDDVLGGGIGFEYNYHRGTTRFPVRIGYQVAPGGGGDYSDRNALTFGIGYRPEARPFTLDLGIAVPSGGGAVDTALSVTYRLGN